MMRYTIPVAAAVLVACVAPSTSKSTIAASTADAEQRDVAAAIATYTVRAYQPVVVSAEHANLSSLPALADAAAPVRVTEEKDGSMVTVIGPYLDAATGHATVTRIATDRSGGTPEARYVSRSLGGSETERGSFTPMEPIRITAN